MEANMGVTVSWDNEAKTTLRYDFQGQWDWGQFRTAALEAFGLTRSAPHRVDTISYFHPNASVPSNAIFQFNKAMKDAPPNRGVTIIVGSSTFIKNLVLVFSKVYKPLGKRLLIASSLEEARQQLSAQRIQQQAQPATV